MERNVIFCFTGTGNCLKVAKDIAATLEHCDLCHMGRTNVGVDVSGCKRVGFIFPVYFLGLPLQVKNFIAGLSIPPDFDGYIFGIATYANVYGNAVKQADALLQRQEQWLDYAANIKMGDNAIAFYRSRPNLKKLAASYKRDMMGVLPKTGACQTSRIGRKFWLIDRWHDMMMPRMPHRDAGFQVLDACTRCGICAKVCPAGNIVLADGKPDFRHDCEQCMACIQLCPQKAIDYKGKCARRGRYRHPEISVNEIIALNAASFEME